MVNDAPCQDCTHREVGCHGKCKNYNEWNEEHIRKKKEESKQRRYGQLAASYVSSAVRRMKKMSENRRLEEVKAETMETLDELEKEIKTLVERITEMRKFVSEIQTVEDCDKWYEENGEIDDGFKHIHIF